MIDINNTDTPYLLGRAVALIQSATELPQRLVSVFANEPLKMIEPWLKDATIQSPDELQEVMDKIDDIPTSLTLVEQGRYWIGYYHQKGDCSFRESVGNQIRAIRISRGLSGKQLAEQADMAESTINKIENGKWSVSLDILERVCLVLDVTISLTSKQ